MQELEHTRKGSTRFLCVEGLWRPLEVGHIVWEPLGRGDSLIFSSADGPVLDLEVPRLHTFEDPVLENWSHVHVFVFSSEDAWGHAARMFEYMST